MKNKQKTLSDISTLEVWDIIYSYWIEKVIICILENSIVTLEIFNSKSEEFSQENINYSVKNNWWKLKEKTNTTDKEKDLPPFLDNENEKFFELFKEIAWGMCAAETNWEVWQEELNFANQAFSRTEACMKKLKEENKL